MKSIIKLSLAAATIVVAGALPAKAADYVMSASADYSGPFADVMPNAMSGIQAVANWWNKEVGKGLGVKVDIRISDMRYDAAVIARTWPAILSRDNPIMHLGFGSPDLTTLMKRLPDDKVPMLIGTAMVGLVWQPKGWHFSIRPTYSHEFAALFSKMQKDKGSKLSIGALSTQTAAGFVDQVKGVEKLAATYPDRFEVVDTQWVAASPVTVTSNIRAMMEKKPDVILVGGTTAQVIATASALEDLKLNIPIVSSIAQRPQRGREGHRPCQAERFLFGIFVCAGQPERPAVARHLSGEQGEGRPMGSDRRPIGCAGVAGVCACWRRQSRKSVPTR